MYRIYLNDTEIKQPSNLVDLILNKSRSDIFNGLIVGDYGYYFNNKGLEISDPYTIDMIKSIIKIDGINTKITTKLTYENEIVFKGYLDISSYKSFEKNKVTVNLTSETKGDIINAKKLVEYAITPKSKITLTKKNYISGGSYELGDYSKFKVTTTGVPFHVGIPFKSDGKINGMQNSTIGNGTFFIAQKTTTFSILGTINWSENVTHNYDLRIIVNGTTTVLENYTHNAGVEIIRQYSISQTLSLNNGDTVALYLHDATINVSYEVNFLSGTSIIVTDNSDTDSTYSDSVCYGVYAFDAFDAIFAKIDSSIKFESDFFQTGFGKNDFFTNGNNIRGINEDINLSLEYLFSNLDVLYDLKCTFESNVFRIESRKNSKKQASFLNTVPSNYTETVDKTRLFSSVKVGFNTWQSESKIKGLEHNSTRTYETDITTETTQLNLMCDFVTAGYIIEEVRRMQFDADTNLEENKFDNNIFLIAVENDAPESVTNYNPLSNIILSGGVYNLKYTPLNILKYNERKLKHLGNISFTSGDGNISLTINGENENRTFYFGNELPLNVSFESVLNFEDFKKIDLFYFEYFGETKYIESTDIDLSLQQNGLGFIEFNGEIL